MEMTGELLKRARELLEELRDPDQMPADRQAVADAMVTVLDAIERAQPRRRKQGSTGIVQQIGDHLAAKRRGRVG